MANQPTSVATRKVGAGTLAGALSVVLVAILDGNGVEISAAVAAAITTILTFITAYVVPERDQAV